jgi:hypothetical protein
MNNKLTLNRRNLIKASGLGALLPLLESAAGEKRTGPPKRVIFIGYGYGHYGNDWYPDNNAKKYICESQEKIKPFKLTPSLKGLAGCKNDVSLISNLSPIHARRPHAGCDTLLTCANADSNPLRAFTNTISVDQVIAREVGRHTRISSMQVNGRTGNHDGWGHGASLSCGANGEFLNGLNTLEEVYNRSFGDPSITAVERKRRLMNRQSLLSLTNAGTKSLKTVISSEDRERLMQFTESIRGIEKRVQKDISWATKPFPKTSMKRPSGKLAADDKIKTEFDLMTEILRTDITRVMTYRMSSIGLMQQMGYQQNTHAMSHWGHHPQDLKCQVDRDKKLVELFAYFINNLKNVKEIDGSSLLDNTLIFFGTGIRVHHNVKNIPMMVAGGGGTKITQGKHFTYKPSVTPLGNLWLSTINHFGINAESFGDSDNTLSEIFS